ncbi:MAG: tRNA preQ1(34) S-adenosylmethionine ribosyltransferase-isomerase QueA [Anaerolineales bacterium]
MKTSDFDYHLPESSIAQTPAEPRDSSRLLVLHRDTGTLEHRLFRDVTDYLRPGDLLVVNQTRVIPARIFARKETGGRVEILLLRRRDILTWEALVGGKGLRIGRKVFVDVDIDLDAKDSSLSSEPAKSGDFAVQAEVIEILEGSERLIRFSEPIETYFSKVGNVPLPPYIHEKLNDPERYQTVYAKEPGSAAAPTAGLHFTPRLLEELQVKGVKIAYVTLHVGLDTFAPVTEDDPEEHKIHTEWCELPQETADAINQTKKSGGRVVAVGTTSVRTLESAATSSEQAIVNRQLQIVNPEIAVFKGPTSLFILPGYQFKVVDVMITNFHLPKSTLLMLVSAFAGREKILETYKTAVDEGYRFYSFGDAMLIL